MFFENASFIKPNVSFKPDYTGRNYAPKFRKVFSLSNCSKAYLSV